MRRLAPAPVLMGLRFLDKSPMETDCGQHRCLSRCYGNVAGTGRRKLRPDPVQTLSCLF